MTTSDASAFLLDVNVLVALTNPNHIHHASSHRWLSTVDAWATTPMTESALIRLLLNRAITGQEVTTARAMSIVRHLRNQPASTFIPDDTTLTDSVIDLTGLVGSKQVTDFHLVNLAAVNGTVLATFDSHLAGCLPPDHREHVHVVSD